MLRNIPLIQKKLTFLTKPLFGKSNLLGKGFVVLMAFNTAYKTNRVSSLFTKIYCIMSWPSTYFKYGMILRKSWSFPLTISSVNVTKSSVSSAVSCVFGHIYWRSLYWNNESLIFCAVWPWLTHSWSMVIFDTPWNPWGGRGVFNFPWLSTLLASFTSRKI